LRAIKEARGDTLVFVDDDNVLAPDFLERIEAIAEQYPYLGVFGAGSVEPEFEIEPPPELARLAAEHGGLLPLLALKRVSSAAWSNNPMDRSSMPWGAGLCVPRETAAYYVELTQRLDVSEMLDRRGKELLCAGDDLFSWAAASMGKGFGVFPELRVIHLISARRVLPGYFLRLIHGWWLSEAILNYLMMGVEPRTMNLERRIRILLGGLSNGLFHIRYKLAGARGEAKAHQVICEKQLKPVNRSLEPCVTGCRKKNAVEQKHLVG
jgi:hypothetical protein